MSSFHPYVGRVRKADRLLKFGEPHPDGFLLLNVSHGMRKGIFRLTIQNYMRGFCCLASANHMTTMILMLGFGEPQEAGNSVA